MISSNEFKEKWNKDISPLVEYSEEVVNGLNIPIESKRFLIESGLPESAAPFLSFETMDKGALLRLIEKYNLDKDYIYIGFTGEGDILAIENNSGIVITINHETYEESYVNNSVQQLAESLLEYSEFIKRIKKVNGGRAYLNKTCSREELNILKDKLTLIDDRCLDSNSFWWNKISSFE